MATPAPGLYERLITEQVEADLRELERDLVLRGAPDSADSYIMFARHIGVLAARALRAEKNPEDQLALANGIVAAIGSLSKEIENDDRISNAPDRLLKSIAAKRNPDHSAIHPLPPTVPLGSSALLVNGRGQPSVGSEIRRELASADRVDLICAFITWPGIRLFEEELADLVRRGGRLRVITTTYLGATDKRALDRLCALGALLKVSYDTRSTRLHAKAWLFRRRSGFDTGYVGSSNLSQPAQTTGLEWNVRLSGVEQAHLLETFEDTFDEYWASPDFADYEPQRDGPRLEEALQLERGGPKDIPLKISRLEVRPWTFQEEILDGLAAERQIHDRWHNLVVMATGTGKTVVAGLDYRRLREAGTVDSLLFVAHRQEILSQSRDVFRQVVQDGAFGELLGDGQRPQKWRHVFGSIQSLRNMDLTHSQFDMVIIDEFHHAAAESYRQLLNRISPRVLLGLTATPERADGQDVKEFFDGHVAVELRLWEALERGLLSPFQYFGISDSTDLSRLGWRGGRYQQLDQWYTGRVDRVRLITKALTEKVANPGAMRAIGFCAGIAHANFMAEQFRSQGIPAHALTSDSSDAERRDALDALSRREVNVLFTVDLFNEGIDLPTIDTILLLRPTESATVFLQQLGRGLRIAPDKPCLTVLDFIGVQHQNFRFDLRYRALSGVGRRDLETEVASGFPTLPPGCHISLDPVASKHILEHVKRSVQLRWQELIREVAPKSRLSEFLATNAMEPADLYRRKDTGWIELRRAAGIETRSRGQHDRKIGSAIARLLHTDDPERLLFWRQFVGERNLLRLNRLDAREMRLARMLQTSLFGEDRAPTDLEQDFAALLAEAARCDELVELSDALGDRLTRVTPTLSVLGPSVPLRLHARYSRFEVLRAFGANDTRFTEGVKQISDARSDLFFVTLRKSERHFSPSTMYADHAIAPDLFQWESQSTTSSTSPTATRYINHEREGYTVHLFLRETRRADGQLGAPPFFYAGPMKYVEHSGSRPVRFIWRLTHPLPADVFRAAKVATG